MVLRYGNNSSKSVLCGIKKGGVIRMKVKINLSGIISLDDSEKKFLIDLIEKRGMDNVKEIWSKVIIEDLRGELDESSVEVVFLD